MLSPRCRPPSDFMKYVVVAATIAVAIWTVLGPPQTEHQVTLKQLASRP